MSKLEQMNARRSVPQRQGVTNPIGFVTQQGTEQRPFPTRLLSFSKSGVVEGCVREYRVAIMKSTT